MNKVKKIESILLTGGTTACELYSHWGSGPQATIIKDSQLYFGDERWVPSASEYCNSKMFSEVMNLDLKDAQIFPIHTGFQDPETAAKYYSEHFPKEIDLGLFSVGEDGHFASIFPFSESGMSVNDELYVFVNNSPKIPKERISISFNGIKRIENIIVLACGYEKGEILRKAFENPQKIEELPIRKLIGHNWYLDKKAYEKMKPIISTNLHGTRIIYER